MCNKERLKFGVDPLIICEKLKQIARYKSNEMLKYDYFNHKSIVTGYLPLDLAKSMGYNCTSFGENIWMKKILVENPCWTTPLLTERIAVTIVNDWMNSPGHRANVLGNVFDKIGVGFAYYSNFRVYVTQEFSN